jgi:hypothetical protein
MAAASAASMLALSASVKNRRFHTVPQFRVSPAYRAFQVSILSSCALRLLILHARLVTMIHKRTDHCIT